MCSYKAVDPVTLKKSREAWVSILVRSPQYWNTIKKNTGPTAQPGSLTVGQGSVLVGTLNATDDYDSRQQLMFSISQPPRHGTITLQNFTFTYKPDQTFHGEDWFVFRASSRRQLLSFVSSICACMHVWHQIA